MDNCIVPKDSILSLSPNMVWKHFANICKIPHTSKHEQAILQHIIAFANQHNLTYVQDSIGNIVIYKPASSGYESKPTIALQAHVDMVPQKNQDSSHNFLTDAIQPRIVGNVVKASNTTLGADNGIGLAAILAILESKTISHGTIEALFTIDEETGMTGAKNLDPKLIHAQYMINTDSEIENEITIGCAGGIDGNFTFSTKRIPVPTEHQSFAISISGLTGGHSGFEIHLGRANANICIAQLLRESHSVHNSQINSLCGGNMRNAIPREAHATIVVPNNNVLDFLEYAESYFTNQKMLHKHTDANFSFSIQPTSTPDSIIEPGTCLLLLKAICHCPNEVIGVDAHNSAIIQTSSNISIIHTEHSHIEIQCLLRSSDESEKQKLATSMNHMFSLYGAQCNFSGDYPGWKPIWDSNILSIVSASLQTIYKAKPQIHVVHAGLECGIFTEIYPHIEYVSFGPTIRNPHSPDEEVDIESVTRFWDTLCLVLQSI